VIPTPEQRERQNARRRVTPQPKKCVICGKTFTPKRSDARTCSDRCRQVLSRSKRRVAVTDNRRIAKGADKRDTAKKPKRRTTPAKWGMLGLGRPPRSPLGALLRSRNAALHRSAPGSGGVTPRQPTAWG
jgi:predicted nucleic acid-binding Zn ribbon protein